MGPIAFRLVIPQNTDSILELKSNNPKIEEFMIPFRAPDFRASIGEKYRAQMDSLEKETDEKMFFYGMRQIAIRMKEDNLKDPAAKIDRQLAKFGQKTSLDNVKP